MKRLYIALFLLMTIFQTHAQPYWQWARVDSFGSAFASPAYKQAIAATPSRELWAILQKAKYNVSPAYYGDYKLGVYNTKGTLLNSTMLDGKVVIIDMKADASGNWYILGRYNDSLRYGSFSQVKSNTTAPYHFLMRLNGDSLKMQWYQPLGTNYFASSASFSLRGNNLYVPVDSYLTTTIYKVDMATGNRTAVVRQAKAGSVSSVVADDNGNLYVAGSCPSLGMDTFGTQIINNAKPYAAYIIRYKPNGDYAWSIFMNDNTCNPRRLNIANNNTIYYTGGLHDTFSIGGIILGKPVVLSGANYIAASIDSNGIVRWVKETQDSPTSRADLENLFTATVDDSILVVAPAVQNNVDFGNGVTGSFSTQHATALVAYNPDGTTAWMRQINATNTAPQHLSSNGKDLWITGAVMDNTSVILDTITIPLISLTWMPYMAKLNNGVCTTPSVTINSFTGTTAQASWDTIAEANHYELVVSKTPPPYTNGSVISQNSIGVNGLEPGTLYYICIRTACVNGGFSDWSCGTFTTSLGISTTINHTSITVYPNPADHLVNIKGLDKTGETAQLKITGITGSVIHERTLSNPHATEAIDISAYARGMYFITIKTPQGTVVQKLMLQ